MDDKTDIAVSQKKGMVLADSYRIEHKIAEGGFGFLYVAEHLRLEGHKVAVKILKESVMDRPEILARFEREAKVSSNLSHPHIVQVTDWGRLPDGKPFLVMELLRGESLDRRIDRGPVSVAQALRLLSQLGSALAMAHDQGVVHRDLKPSNIFLVNTGRREELFAKVLDFGISKIMTDRTLQQNESAVLGSPGHMAPEQALGHNHQVGPRSDQFSLGIIAYELFTGRSPFASDTMEALLYNIVHQDPQPLGQQDPDLPAHVIDAVERALAKDPDHRHPSIRAFIKALHGTQDSESPTLNAELANQETFIKNQQDPKRPRTKIWLALGGAILMLLIATGVYLLPADAQNPAKIPTPATPPVHPRPPKLEKPPALQPLVVNNRPPSPAKDRNALPSLPDHPQAQEKLQLAEDSFNSKRYAETLRRAAQSIASQDSARARYLIAVCYCAQQDLSNARASLFKLSAGKKKAAIEHCRKLGLDL